MRQVRKFLNGVFHLAHTITKDTRLNKYMYKSNDPINKITEKIYLGDFRAASDLTILNQYGITHIINCPEDCPEVYPNDKKYLSLNLRDDLTEQMGESFEKSTYFIKSLKDNEKVFVHCKQGKSRSVSVIIAYFIIEHKMKYQEALSMIKNIRAISEPNDNFIRQLKALER